MNNWYIISSNHLDYAEDEYKLFVLYDRNQNCQAYLSYVHKSGYWYIDRYDSVINNFLPSELLEAKFSTLDDALLHLIKIKDWLNENQL